MICGFVCWGTLFPDKRTRAFCSFYLMFALKTKRKTFQINPCRRQWILNHNSLRYLWIVQNRDPNHFQQLDFMYDCSPINPNKAPTYETLISSFLEFSKLFSLKTPYWLVVGLWNMNFIFPFIWEFHHPNWRTPSFFQRGRKNHQPAICHRPSGVIKHGWKIHHLIAMIVLSGDRNLHDPPWLVGVPARFAVYVVDEFRPMKSHEIQKNIPLNHHKSKYHIYICILISECLEFSEHQMFMICHVISW